MILKPPTAASMQEKQNLQEEKRKSREATSYKSNRTTTTIKLCRNANTDSSWNSFQRRTYILKTTLPATGTKPLPFLHHRAKHKTQGGKKNTYTQTHTRNCTMKKRAISPRTRKTANCSSSSQPQQQQQRQKRIQKLVECQENRSQEVATSSLSRASEPARLIPARFQVKSRLGFTKRERDRERQRESVCRERDAECELVLKSSVLSKK